MKDASKTETFLGNNLANFQVEIITLKKANLELTSNIKKLTNSNQKFSDQIKERDNQIKEKDNQIKTKDFEIAYYRKLLFGRRSEKAKYLTVDEKQLSIFDDIERHDKKAEEEAESNLSTDIKKILAERKRLKELEKEYKKNKPNKKPKGRRLFRHSNPDVEVERREIDLSEEEKQCSCGSCLTRIQDETSETIEYIPAKIKIVEHVRFKYACKSCEGTVKIAKKADKVFSRTAASSSLLSHILVSKFEDHLPFYRQNNIFKRYNIDISDKLMNNWFFKSSKRLSRLFVLLGKELTSSDYIAIDETTINTINKSISNQSYMWVYQSKDRNKQLVYYDFCLDRSSKNPQLILPANYRGYIQTDGYSGYSFLDNKKNVVRLGCMAHARRKFSDIAKLIKIDSSSNSKDIIAHNVLNKINMLYLIERRIEIEDIRDLKVIEDLRQQESKPLLTELYDYIVKKQASTLPGSPIHKALNYFINQYPHLRNYLKDPKLDIDNNKTEQAIRPFALGRKNWLFVSDEQGGAAVGTIYSLIESAKLNGLNTQKYLKYLLDNVKDEMDEDQLKKLLPNRIDKNLIQGCG